MRNEKIVIIGGSITGLTGALALKAQGFDVTIVDRDPSPPASIQPMNSNAWVRRGALHALQPHVLTARLRNRLHEWYPELVRELLEAGAWEQPFSDIVRPDAASTYAEPEDDEPITVLMARRTTLELVMRRHLERRGIATFLDGRQVTGLLIDGEGAHLTVRGVRLKYETGEHDLLADVVVDASGRTTKFADQLRKANARIEDEHYSSNTVYYARHYRLKPGCSFPRTYGLSGVLFGDMTAAALPGDNGAIVVTMAVFKDDPLLYQSVGRLDVFEEICRRIPRVAAWVDPALSEPTSDVMAWANMDFLWRTTVSNGAPQVLGYFFAGDTTLRSNPKYGRGCTCGAIGAHILAQTLASESNPVARAIQYEAALHAAFRKEWEDLLSVDRRDYARFQATAGLRPPTVGEWLQARLQDHVLRRAITIDPRVQRKIMKGFYGLEDASAWTKDLRTWLRIAATALPVHDPAIFKDFSARPSRAEIRSMIEAAPPG